MILFLLFFCHFLADYTPLSTSWMLAAKRFGTPIFPIFCHAGVHAVLMFVVLICFTDWQTAIILAIFQLITHWIIDVIKGLTNKAFSEVQNPANNWHWIVFGADQYLHAIIILLMAKLAS